MDSLEVNKILGALLGTLLFAMSLNIAVGAAYAPKKPAVPGYDLPAAEEGAGAGHVEEAKGPAEPLPVLLAKADPAKGQKTAQLCTQCHIFQKEGPKKPGPSLYGVVGRPVASGAGFSYSSALKSKGGAWDPEHINEFIANPKKYAPGTLMTFQGLPKAEQRADVIAFLNTLSDDPKPLPKAQ